MIEESGIGLYVPLFAVWLIQSIPEKLYQHSARDNRLVMADLPNEVMESSREEYMLV